LVECEVAGERLVLLAEKAAFWPRGGALFIADFHLGKAATFRRAGIPLPAGTTSENLARLDRAVERTRAAQVIFLGDFSGDFSAQRAGVLATVFAVKVGICAYLLHRLRQRYKARSHSTKRGPASRKQRAA
jgi:hypothetical protein